LRIAVDGGWLSHVSVTPAKAGSIAGIEISMGDGGAVADGFRLSPE
jgi:hypothetical protein